MSRKEAPARKRQAGAFDIRNVIGGLIGIYGVILLVATWAVDPGVDPTTGELKNGNYNLWCGIAMIVVALVFLAWAKLRPIIVPVDPAEPGQQPAA